ncbi:deleted in malignant brain tumors 1 protein-like isoform X2 [Patiria miniata]|uniref:SRCR domain-containing protein n=1 Tax=Patiria miniata TaxID=46514 RepID=A0A914AVS1_PATMI|nr:deleted in malignant brain tumors 1 protein-like isoform X2 [Patiria miniata]
MNGSSSAEGRVEVYFQGEWGTVCDDLFDIQDATVICHQLGFPSALRAVSAATEFSMGSGAILLDDLECSGDESTLADCSHARWSNCEHSEDVGVVCSTSATAAPEVSGIPDGRVRLVDGSSSSEGRVEVFYQGNWGTVCDDAFDIQDATVICHQLGFPSAVGVVSAFSEFAIGSGPILLDNLGCYGDESTLADCSHTGWTAHDCSHLEDVGVICSTSATVTEGSEMPDGSVRLVDGNSPSEGRVEVYYRGQWGTVCDDLWDIQDATVVCRQLGFPSALRAVSAEDEFTIGDGPIFFDDVECVGDEATLADCRHLDWDNCAHSEDAGVFCVPLVMATEGPDVFEDGSVRLVGGDSSHEGRVEVYYRGQWGTVCDDLWDIDDATVVCRQLGFPSAIRALSAADEFPVGEGPIFLDDVECSGDESTLADCSHRGWNDNNCGHSEDAGVICSTTTADPEIAGIPDGSVRLVDGSSSSEGRVEVFYQGNWGTVCDDAFDIQDATVICHQLGFPSAVGVVSAVTKFAMGSGPILLDNLGCYGEESTLADCSHAGWTVHNCEHSEDVGVICSSSASAAPEVSGVPDGSVRLEGGSSAHEGRVEVYYRGSWGTVCDDSWDINAASVVCRQLGFTSAEAALNSQEAGFGMGERRILLDEVECSGEESNLYECRYKEDHNCNHSEDAGVVCIVPTSTQGSIVSGSVRLVSLGNSPDSEGRLEMFVDGEWLPVCNPGWDMTGANMVCRQLGFSSAINTNIAGVNSNGQGSSIINRVSCTGSEVQLKDCKVEVVQGSSCHDASAGSDVIVQCLKHRSDGDVKLAGSEPLFKGEVQILLEGVWGAVCDTDWQLSDGEVVCRQLGYSGAKSVYQSQNPRDFGNEDSAFPTLRQPMCSGMESKIMSCKNSGWSQDDKCEKGRSGVECNQQKGLLISTKQGQGLANGLMITVIAIPAASVLFIIVIIILIIKVRGQRTRTQSHQMTISPSQPPCQCSKDRPDNASDDNCYAAVGGPMGGPMAESTIDMFNPVYETSLNWPRL